MAPPSSLSQSPPSHTLILSFLTLISLPISSFSFPTLQNNPKFDSNIALFGDAQLVNGGSSVQLTLPLAYSFGLITHNKPFKFLDPTTPSPTSFSTDFTFSISPQTGDGLALIFAPTDSAAKFSGKTPFGLSREIRFLGIEFDTSRDDDVGDESSNHVGIDVGSLVSARISNVSSVNLVLNSGLKFRSWVDYDASSKRLEVRLSELGVSRPYDPLLTYPIDLSEMWKGEEVFVGISSSSGNSSQTSSVYSWSFRVRNVPRWMHSQPVDPRVYSKSGIKQKKPHKRSLCPLAILPGLIVLIGCGALVAFAVMFLWTVSVRRYTVIPAANSKCPVNFRYEKINVVAQDSLVDVKK